MFATKNAEPSADLQRAATEFFSLVNSITADGAKARRLPLADQYRLQMLLIATLQGIATLAVRDEPTESKLISSSTTPQRCSPASGGPIRAADNMPYLGYPQLHPGMIKAPTRGHSAARNVQYCESPGQLYPLPGGSNSVLN
jgi:hypothetical protein